MPKRYRVEIFPHDAAERDPQSDESQLDDEINSVVYVGWDFVAITDSADGFVVVFARDSD
jgi:hypothetical protein